MQTEQTKLSFKLIFNRIYLAVNVISLLICINLQTGFLKELSNSQLTVIFFPFIAYAPFILVAYFFMFRKIFEIPNPDRSLIMINLLILLYLTVMAYLYMIQR